MKVQLSICVSGVPNPEDSYFATVVKDDVEVSKSDTRVGDGPFPELVIFDDENVTVQVTISSATTNDVVVQQSFDVSAALNSYTKCHVQPSSSEGGAVIAIHVSEQANGQLRLIMQGHDLPNTDWGLFGSQFTDPIYEIYNHMGKKVARSNKVEDNLNPVWDQLLLDLEELCGNDLDTPLRITVFDRDEGERVEYLGFLTMSVQQMLSDGATKVPLLKGGSPVEDASLSVQEAELLPYVTVPQSAIDAMEAALSARSDLAKLKEQVTTLQESAKDAHSKADSLKSAAKEKQAAADVEAKKQLELKTKFSKLAREATEAAKAAETREFSGMFHLTLAAQDLADLDFGGRNKSDPLYEIFLLSESGGAPLLRSPKVEDNLNPEWEEQKLDIASVANLDTPLKIQLSDKDAKDAKVPLGFIETTINKLLDCRKEGHSFIIPLQEQPNAKKDTGRLVVKDAKLVDFHNLKDEAAKLKSECEAVKVELDAATKVFGDAQKAAEAAGKEAAQAAEEAARVEEHIKAAEMAVKMAETSF